MTVVTDSSAKPPKEATVDGKNVESALEDRKTPWRSVWICIFMQFIVGIQISIYYMSMWPYLSGMDKSATMDFLGWVVASCSLGCSVANPIFGYWNQKTMSVTHPTIFGFVISALGQLLYGLLPLFSSNQKWIMIGARLITGFGTGCLAVLRAYTATAAVPKDKLAAISYGTAGWVLGISFGPAIQAFFTPVGDGWSLGPLVIDMYTLPAFVMVIITLASCPVMWIFLTEDYAGIIDGEDDEGKNIVIPKYDVIAALVCVWNWVCSCMIATNIEVMSTPMTTVMFDWKDSTSVLYNGIIQSLSCLVSVAINFLIGYTRIGKIDKRKQVIFGLLVFILYHLCNFPWPFYPGPLKYIPAGNTSAEVGGCDPSYTWCEHSVAIPMPVYIFCYIVFYGIAFPFVGSPSGTLYAEILGPRPQGMMQGMYSFGGSAAQFAAPILATFLFQHSGYLWVIVTQMITLSIAVALMLIFYKRLRPLQLRPSPGTSAKYDKGVFYAM